jgi:DNA repair protein RecN (Recombination protein N)
MLKRLDIQNFAIIKHETLHFEKGFHVITGETGAGKSILLGALQLVLGKRADSSILHDSDNKCIVEATFDLKNYHLQNFFLNNELDYEAETIIRREVHPNGKSRAFVNDSPVNLQVLNDLTLQLIDIHSQHQTLEITKNDFQFLIIDNYAHINQPLNDYRLKLKAFKANKVLLEEKKTMFQQQNKEQAFRLFLLQELQEAKIVAHEEVELDIEISKLQHAENILLQLNDAVQRADDDQLCVLQQVLTIKNNLAKIAAFSPDYDNLNQRVQSVYLEFKDIVEELKSEAESVELNPDKLDKLSQRFDVVNQLFKKHAVGNSEELLVVLNQLQNEENQLESLAEEIKNLEAYLDQQERELLTLANQLHETRGLVKKQVSDAVEQIIKPLGMQEAKFEIQLSKTSDFNWHGNSQIEFMIATNKGSDLQKLSKVASGGEMSRIVLAFKAILAEKTALPTIIFDEIDTGVSGDIANKMADIMQSMSQFMQIVAITHLPQVASKGSVHFKVFKDNDAQKTVSSIKVLDDDQRILEIAQMISGEEITTFAQNHAKTLLNIN